MTTPEPLLFTGAGPTRLAGDAFGDPRNPHILLLHGAGQTRHSWSATAASLAAEGWYAIALDHRGHGESEWAPDHDYSMSCFVEDVRRVVQSLECAPAVVGASLGGMAALIAEGESADELFASLVLVDIAPKIEMDGAARILGFMSEHMQGFETVESAADAIASFRPDRPRPTDLQGLRKNLRRGEDGRYYWHWDPELLAGSQSLVGRRDPNRLLRAARSLSIPTLLVRGRHSDVLSDDGVREFRAAVPHARYVDVSDAGHMVVGDRNDAFRAAVVAFLGEHHRSEIAKGGGPADGARQVD